jgi:hypothetical protein
MDCQCSEKAVMFVFMFSVMKSWSPTVTSVSETLIKVISN